LPAPCGSSSDGSVRCDTPDGIAVFSVRILATGTGGMLGSALIPELHHAGHDIVATDLVAGGTHASGEHIEPLDVRSVEHIEDFMASTRPDLVVHLAAETSLEACEIDRAHGWLTNAIGTKLVALACRRAGAQIAFVSSAGVFDGTKEAPYDEFDEPNPVNCYGLSKHAAERYVRELLPESFIVRAGWMFGGGEKDHKFVAKIVNQLAQGATTLYAVGDKLGTPTYAPDFARCFVAMLSAQSFGLYHMACKGRCSRLDVTVKILEVLGRGDVEVVEVGSDHFAEEFFAPRPRSEVMRNLVLEMQGLDTMRSWESALAEYLEHNFVHPSGRLTASSSRTAPPARRHEEMPA
jgi:dTDP-4-dehydrorhamnose reductase